MSRAGCFPDAIVCLICGLVRARRLDDASFVVWKSTVSVSTGSCLLLSSYQ